MSPAKNHAVIEFDLIGARFHDCFPGDAGIDAGVIELLSRRAVPRLQAVQQIIRPRDLPARPVGRPFHAQCADVFEAEQPMHLVHDDCRISGTFDQIREQARGHLNVARYMMGIEIMQIVGKLKPPCSVPQ